MPTSTLVPDGTAQNDGTLTGGATLHAVTSDASDASYVTLATGQQAFVTMTTFSLPGGAFIKTVTIRIRQRMVSGTAVTRLQADAIGSSDLAAITSTSFAEYSSFAMQWLTQTQAAIDALRVRVKNQSGGGAIRVAEIAADVAYATQPTVTVTAPTGTVGDTTSPTVTWTYTPGTDGGPQSRYRVKIFSAAQYGAAGFNPSTSEAVWDSGDQSGDAQSLQVGTALASGTYRAYVNVAQTINGQAHASEWAYSGFVEDATTPDAPTVTAVADNDDARIRVTVTRAVGDIVPCDLMDVERSDDSGATWVFVRGATRVAPPGDVLIIYDYEAPNGTAVRYRARCTDQTATGDNTGPWGTSADVTWTSPLAWLKDLQATSLSIPVIITDLSDVSRPIAQGINRILGRRTPVVVSDVRQAITGTVTFLTDTTAGTADLRALLELSDVLFLQTPDATGFGGRYVTFGEVTEQHPGYDTDPVRRWICPFVEVDRPVDVGITVAGFTYQDLDDAFADYQAIVNAALTYGAIYTAA